MIEVRPAPPEHYGWIAERAGLVAGPQFRALEAVAGERILGMVGYDGWTPNSCTMHVAIEEPIAVRRLLARAFDVPLQLDQPRRVALAAVLSNNEKSLRFTEHLGFERVAELRDAWEPGVHLVLFRMALPRKRGV